MVLSTQFNVARKIGEHKAIEMIAEAGFDALDYSLFSVEDDADIMSPGRYEKRARQLASVAGQCGVFFNQAHAPFPSYKAGDESYNDKTFAKIVRAIEVAAILGASSIVVHPIYVEKDKKQFNMEFFGRLKRYCRQFGIRVAIENMWMRDPRRGCIVPSVCSVPEEFADFLDTLGGEHFTGCLDIGHCGLAGIDEAHAIKTLGRERLKALHVHDTDYKVDMHTLPYMAKLDWDAITAALKDIRYDGDFTFEADNFVLGVPEELLPQAYRYMHDTGRFLIQKCVSKE